MRPGLTVGQRLALIRSLRESEPRRSTQVRSDINVTPLVDVALVLLMIFMVVTPLLASGVAVDLPLTTHHSQSPDDGKDIIVSITADKRIYVGAKHVSSPEELVKAVATERLRLPHGGIFLKGDARVPYGPVREAMQALRESNIEDVILATDDATKVK